MPDRSREDAPRFSIDLDDIADVEDLELPEPHVHEPVLALGSEMRPRVVIEKQGVPSDLDVALMAYLLDLDVPADPVPSSTAPATGEDDSVDESPTPSFRRG